jgi:hypothetical protein
MIKMEINIKKESLRSIGISGLIFYIIIMWAGFQYGFDMTPAIKTIVFGIILGSIIVVFLHLMRRYLKRNPAVLEKHSILKKGFLIDEFPEYTRTGYYVAIYYFFMAGIFIIMAISYFPPPLWEILMIINFLPHGFLWPYLNYLYNKNRRNRSDKPNELSV